MSGWSRRTFLTRSLALGITAPSLAAALAACSGDDGENLDDKPTVPRVNDGTRRYRGRIVVATLENPPRQAQQELAAAYRRHQPDVEIVWETKDYPDTKAYASWLGTQLGDNRIGPDIVSGNYGPIFRRYVNFDEYRAQTNPYTGQAWEKDYAFGLFRDLDPRGDRTLIGTDAVRLYWYYNKDVFAKVGVDPPADWSALVDVSRKLKAAGHIPISTNFDYVIPGWFASIYFDQYHTSWVNSVRARPGDWNWSPETDGDFTYDPNNPRLHATYTFSPQRFYAGLKDRALRFDTPRVADIIGNFSRVFPEFSTSDFFVRSDQYTPFLQQRAAILVDGSWTLTRLPKDLQGISADRLRRLDIEQGTVRAFEWDVMEFPPMSGSRVQAGVRSPESTGGEYLSVVDKGVGRTEMVMDFVMFWISRAGYSAFVRGQGEAKELTPQGPSMISGIDYPKDIQDRISRVEPKGITGPAYGGFWVNGAGGRSTDALRNLFITVLQRKIKPDDYAVQLQQYVEKNFASILSEAGLSPADIATPERQPGSV
ncbi:ABC transporter substrate-binding protein [Actinopolymorpha alba]|uniref:ABC transporter substrate-binding protein n=1 Tax=Actinopolymorpha alba TaxID=533267 RepID=UPI000360AB7B|nr:extracellular solute-binding protein [Actinopolymorpha alba]